MIEWLTLSFSPFFMVQEITSQRFDPSIWHSVKTFEPLRTNLKLNNSICYLPPSDCCELKVWIHHHHHPQICMLKLNPHCDGIQQWCLWEVIRSWGWSPREWERYPREMIPLHHGRINEKTGSLNTRKWVPTRHWIYWCLHLGLLTSRTERNKCILFKPPRLWL